VDPGTADTAEEPPAAPAPGRQGLNPHEGFRVPPDVRRSIGRAMESMQHSRPALDALAAMHRHTAQLGQHIARAFTPQLDALLAEVGKSVSTSILASPHWQQTMAGLRALSESMLRYWPDNWEGVDTSDIGTALRIAKDEGLPLVWVPRAELVQELLAVPDAAARRALLETHVDDIVSDCAEVTDREYHSELVAYADRLQDVVEAHRAGLHAPGQSLAAVVVTALLQWVYGHGELRRVKASPMRAKAEDEQVLRDLKVAVLIEAAVPAVQGGMDKLSDDELPDGFNRNATLHRVAARAYTVPNAMCALMLATGLLAEAQQLLEDGRLTA
jgi:hypothetical protein